MTLKELKALIDEFEKDGRQCMGVNLPVNIAAELRQELHHLYGIDPGRSLVPLFGVQVLSTNARILSFEE